MLAWFKGISQKWSGWISDSDLERSLRAHISGRGFYGDSAQFVTFRLVAIQRPGWLQVFSFSVDARVANEFSDSTERVRLFGLVKQDERYKKCDIELFPNTSERHAAYLDWTDDLIRLRKPNL